MTLSSADLVRLEAAHRLLVSPLAAPSPEAWILEAGAALRDLVRGTGVVLQLPSDLPQVGAPYFSEDATEVARGVLDLVDDIQREGARFTDPVTDLWNRLRREQRVHAFSWDRNRCMVEACGVSINQGLLIDDLRRKGYHDFVGLVDRTPHGESMIWVLHQRHDAFPFGEEAVALLSALVPAFRAGLDTLGRLGAHRAALDAVGEPLAAFGPDGTEVHRNPALTRLLADEPEAAGIEARLRHLGRQALQLLLDAGRAATGDLTREHVVVHTARGTYTLRPTALPPGLFGPDPSLLVTVASDVAVPMPAPEALRARLGLTRREAEIALLLAEGLSNSAIAERLFVSPHTARHHVESVLAKLEVPSRAAVAARLLGTGALA